MTTIKDTTAGPELETVHIEGVEFLRLRHPDRMPPFLMTLASDTDCWAFIASSGGMTVGRVDPDGALFPYETVDRLYDSHEYSGPITLIRVGHRVWEPFTREPEDEVERCLDKSVLGHQLVFEEHHRGLGLRVRARWAACDALGHVRTVSVENTGEDPIEFEVLDGLNVNGTFTLGENIGDLGGLSIALKAYKLSLDGREAPVIDGFTGEQRVFIGWAQAWNKIEREAYLRQQVNTDPHSPARFRVNGVVRNVPEFYTAFDVKPGDALYLPPEERVKIW